MHMVLYIFVQSAYFYHTNNTDEIQTDKQTKNTSNNLQNVKLQY